jgi:transposase
VHRSKVVKDFAAANRIKLIYNAAYSSEYNPIERLFAVCKRKFRKLLLQTSEVKTQNVIRRLVRQSVTDLDCHAIKSHVNSCIALMKQISCSPDLLVFYGGIKEESRLDEV